MKYNYNLIAVFDETAENLLFCLRRKNPFKGLYNFVGGHIEAGESGEDAAYRELFEETGITRADITLRHLMDFTYYNQGCYVEVWCGRLQREVALREEAHPLEWLDITGERDFFTMREFDGEGNIGHMIEQLKQFGEGFLE